MALDNAREMWIPPRELSDALRERFVRQLQHFTFSNGPTEGFVRCGLHDCGVSFTDHSPNRAGR